MATYAIGDIQGCRAQLDELLELIGFDSTRDKLWLVGDVVNRGPDSLGVLRTAYRLRDQVSVVLGNHDLHLLAVVAGHRKPARGDTIDDIVAAPDRVELIDWLRHQPLVVHSSETAWTMVHAGIPPQWTIEQALSRSAQVEQALRDENWSRWIGSMYGNTPTIWNDNLKLEEQLRYIINAFTRMRYVDAEGALELSEKAAPGQQAEQLQPWYEAREKVGFRDRIVFGHWATLQNDRPLGSHLPVLHVDTGCVWGGPLTAARLEDKEIFQVAGLKR